MKERLKVTGIKPQSHFVKKKMKGISIVERTPVHVNSDSPKPEVNYSNLAKSIGKKVGELLELKKCTHTDDYIKTLNKSCIYKVHARLRNVKKEAYTPIAVSIGPYHHGKEKLRAMEERKLWYLHSFLERKKENTIKSCILELAELEDKARKYYADPIDTYFEPEKFLEMMLLDGCFIIEFFRNRKLSRQFQCEYQVICRDMILLENQLPYFVLTKLYDMTEDSEDSSKDESLRDMILQVFTDMFPIPGRISGGSIGTCRIKHLLHLVHVHCCPPVQHTSIAINNCSSLLCCSLFKPAGTSDNENQMRSAVELHEAGVEFKVIKVYDEFGFFGIKFENGVMEIPSIRVHDSAEDFFRNLVAYEQHSSHVLRCFTDYISFMDQLINSEKDVNLLRLEGIIDNWLGDDQEVCKLFNRLGDGVNIDSSSFYYTEVCNEVNKHCEIPCNQTMAKLRHNYFNTPWAGVSTVAAGVLLVLTLLQTIAAFMKK